MENGAIPRADLAVPFLDAETVWTESSHKYSAKEMSRIAPERSFGSHYFSATLT